MEAFFVVNIPDVAGKFSDIVERLRGRDVVEDKLLDRRPGLNERSIDSLRDAAVNKEPGHDILDDVAGVDRRMLLVGLVDVGDEVAVGDLGVVNAREALDPEPFARVDLLFDRIDRAGEDQATCLVPDLDDLSDLDHTRERGMVDRLERGSGSGAERPGDRERAGAVGCRLPADRDDEISHSARLPSDGSRSGTGSPRSRNRRVRPLRGSLPHR